MKKTPNQAAGANVGERRSAACSNRKSLAALPAMAQLFRSAVVIREHISSLLVGRLRRHCVCSGPFARLAESRVRVHLGRHDPSSLLRSGFRLLRDPMPRQYKSGLCVGRDRVDSGLYLHYLCPSEQSILNMSGPPNQTLQATAASHTTCPSALVIKHRIRCRRSRVVGGCA
jgi:hypothetical protein